MDAKKKGAELERAVRFIQESILGADPKLAGERFSVESNIIVKIAEVRHEIDVLVKTSEGSPYEALWIFECKNWKDPVGKNEVLILSGNVLEPLWGLVSLITIIVIEIFKLKPPSIIWEFEITHKCLKVLGQIYEAFNDISYLRLILSL